MNEAPLHRTARLPDGAPLSYAPDNEQGVIYLFSQLAPRFGLRVESIQSGYPDCIAYKKATGRRVRIEFEFRSRNFSVHGHDPQKCDWIVCWIHDWPGVPSRLRVVDLRRAFGLGFNVWFQPVKEEFIEQLARSKYNDSWSVPSTSQEGDLLLFYRTTPHRCVKDIFRVVGPVSHVLAEWKGGKGKDYMAPIRRVCTLKAPIHLSELKQHRVIKSAGFVRGNMQGRPRSTPYWTDLHDLILERNPAAAKQLRPYSPDKVL